jgi:Leucine-rich repeat (LRR) protein
MTPEEAYQEALRRIREAARTRALELDLSRGEHSGLEILTRLPPELERLTSLQSLDLSWCGKLPGDLSPLTGLASLQSLDLRECLLNDNLTPLASLTSLRSLNLRNCLGVRRTLPEDAARAAPPCR